MAGLGATDLANAADPSRERPGVVLALRLLRRVSRLVDDVAVSLQALALAGFDGDGDVGGGWQVTKRAMATVAEAMATDTNVNKCSFFS